jgi:hypothetical protein
MKTNSVFNFTAFLIFLVIHTVSSASVSVKTDANKRVQVPIAKDSMNRIAFANDRIAQVFGDEEAYTLQSDERSGQIFLKPTEANGDKPISLTLTTEQNIVQDMELIPQKIQTATIILKGDVKNNIKPEHNVGSSGNGFGFMGASLGGAYLGAASPQAMMDKPTDRIGHLIRIIKDAASQPLTEPEEDKPVTLNVTGVAVEGIRVIRALASEVSIYTLKNTTETDLSLSENSFVGSTVLAVSIEKHVLKPKEITRLFVLRAA